ERRSGASRQAVRLRPRTAGSREGIRVPARTRASCPPGPSVHWIGGPLEGGRAGSLGHRSGLLPPPDPSDVPAPPARTRANDMSTALSVVVPVHDEAPHLEATLRALVRAVRHSAFDAEVVLVDDGSTDGSADVARSALDDALPLTVVVQSNAGRFEARRAGIAQAQTDLVLLFDRPRLL